MKLKSLCAQALAGRRVLVTGDTGFKGSWLALAAHDLGAEVVGYALPPEHANGHYNQIRLHELIRHVDGDVRDADHLGRVFADFAPEYVFHLAAQPLVRLSYKEPRATFETNVMGSINVCEEVRRTASVRSFVLITSDKSYANKEWAWGYRENDELGGRDPYSASKAAVELAFAAYQSSYFEQRAGLGAATVRAGNVIGGGDWSSDRIVPDCIRALSEPRAIVLRNPKSTRPWQHVLEPVFGYLLVAIRLYQDALRYRGAWNFGPLAHDVRPVRELTDLIVRQWGSGDVRVEPDSGAGHEAGLLMLCCDKAAQLLGWRPRWRFETTVAETVAWYTAMQGKEDMREISRRQIREYLSVETP